MQSEKSIGDISTWINAKVKEAGATGVVLGLSGGIDSAVSAAIAKKVYPEDTLGVIMPCHSSTEEIDDAKLTASSLGLNTEMVDLTFSFDTLLQNLSNTDKASTMAIANIMPRLRMTVLYYYAQTYNKLVLGTTNKSEMYIGYFTKYGDGAADLEPLGALTKAEVYKLAKYLEIPERIITKPPKAGIIPGQTDEEELGFSYQQLEDYLMGKQIDSKVEQKIEDMNKKSNHKRHLPPVFYWNM